MGEAAPREDLLRSAPFKVTRAAEDDDGDGLTLEGYAAVFGVTTEIDSWEGTFLEEVASGAFRKSLRERVPRLQFDHGYHPLIGSIPIGRITDIAEDDQGLRVAARLSDNWLVQPIRDAIAEESVDGMSFRFTVVREEWRDKDGKLIKADELAQLLSDPGDRAPLHRTLKEVKVPELGPVVWPAYEATSVGVRSKVTIDLGRLGEPEQRKTLARAVFLADAAERTTGPTETSDAPPPSGHPSEDPPPADAPHSDADQSGEHPSPTPAVSQDDLRQRINRESQYLRDYLPLIMKGASRYGG